MIYYSHDHMPTQEDIKREKLMCLKRDRTELQFKITKLTQELGKIERQIRDMER